MKPSTIAFIAAAGLALAFSGRALWQTANPPAPEAAYVQLFEDHCLSRLAKVQSGSDPFGNLADNAQRIIRLDAAGLQAVQRKRSCRVLDATRLMTPETRLAAQNGIRQMVDRRLPELKENSSSEAFDFYVALTALIPGETDLRWGVIVARMSADSGDTQQSTVTTLSLPNT